MIRCYAHVLEDDQCINTWGWGAGNSPRNWTGQLASQSSKKALELTDLPTYDTVATLREEK